MIETDRTYSQTKLIFDPKIELELLARVEQT